MTTVYVRGLDVYAFHGVPDAEQVVGHRYRIDLTMSVDEQAHHSDLVRETVDYSEAAAIAIEIATAYQFRTVERLAQVIGETLLARLVRTQSVKVKIEKPFPPAPIIAEAAGAELVVDRLPQ